MDATDVLLVLNDMDGVQGDPGTGASSRPRKHPATPRDTTA